MGFWDELRKDIKKGIDEGLHVFKEGTAAIMKKTGILTDDVKKKIAVFELKQKIQVNLTELGGRVYEIASDRRKNPLTDARVKGIVERIKKIEGQIAKIEGKKPAPKARKTGAKGKAKPAAGKTAARRPQRKAAASGKTTEK